MTRFKYSIDIIPEEDGHNYYVVVPALPGCFSQGKTIEEAKQNAVEAIELHIRSLLDKGEDVPIEDKALHTTVEVAA